MNRRGDGPAIVAWPAGAGRFRLTGPDGRRAAAALGLPRIVVDDQALRDVEAWCQAHRLLLVVARRRS